MSTIDSSCRDLLLGEPFVEGVTNANVEILYNRLRILMKLGR